MPNSAKLFAEINKKLKNISFLLYDVLKKYK